MGRTRGLVAPGAVELKRHRFTVDEFHRMHETGILLEDDRIELIDGALIEMAAIGSRHMASVNDGNRILVLGVGDRAIVSIQNLIRLSRHSAPRPDLVWLRPRPDRYYDSLPEPGDVVLVIEVADSSLRYDRQTTVPLYAAAGIPEVWILDIDKKLALVFRVPKRRRYQESLTVAHDGSIAPLAFPDLVIAVRDLVR